MDFKLTSKNNMGIIITFILVILLSQSRFFDFLMDTFLGRLALLAFVIIISFTHKILGLLAVLFIIIAFNHNSEGSIFHNYPYGLYEGFDNTKTSSQTDKQIDKQIAKVAVANAKNQAAASNAVTTSSAAASSETFKGREGFNTSDRELNMLRGKQSNTISVSERQQSDDVSPSDKSVFTSGYASF